MRPKRRGVRSSTGSQRPRRISARFGAEDHQRAGAPFLGPRRAQEGSWPGHFGRPSRRAGRQYLLGRAISDEAGAVWHAYQSAWLPQSLLADNQRERLVDALFAAAKHRGVSLHFNKGLAGATADAIATARDTAMNPAVVDAFALAISGAGGPPAYPGRSRPRAGRRRRATRGEAVTAAMDRNPQAPAARRLLCVGDRLFPAALAGGVLGRELRPASRGQEQIRS